MRYAAIWCDVLTCREKIESNDANWCFLTLFETFATFGGGTHGPANGNVVSNEDSSGKEWEDVYALCNVRECPFLKVISWETYDIHEVLSLQTKNGL